MVAFGASMSGIKEPIATPRTLANESTS